MTALARSRITLALLVFGSVLSGTLLIPMLRPFMAEHAPGNESATHAFMALGLLGAVVASPFVGRLSLLARNTTRLVIAAAVLDALLLGSLSVGSGLSLLLALRAVQGALNLTVISLLLGAAPVSDRKHLGAHFGVLGTAMMLGVALGAPLGTLCLRLGTTGPLLVGASVELLVAALVPLVGLQTPARHAQSVQWAALPWLAMLWVFAERTAVGLFVVTFAFHAKGCLGLSDSQYGLAIGAFMLPFVLAVYPAGQLADRFGATPVAAAGLVVYGVCWFTLASARPEQILLVMVLLGLASGAVFASGLRESGTATGVSSRIASMSALNSAGSLGMLVGTATAGILSAVLRAHGGDSDTTHLWVFRLAGLVVLQAALATTALVLIVQRGARLVRS